MQLGVRAQNDIDVYVFVLVADGAAVLDRCHDVDLVDRRAREPERVECFNTLEHAGHSNGSLQYLDELIGTVLVLERFELSIKHVSEADIYVAFECLATELVRDESVEWRGIIQTVLIEEAVDHAPAPGRDQVSVLVGELVPEILHALHGIHLVADSVLRQDVRVERAHRDATDDLVLSLAALAKVAH